MFILFFLLSYINYQEIEELKYPIAKVENGYITNIDEICKKVEIDEKGNRSWEGICYIPQDTPIKVWIDKENKYNVYCGYTLIVKEEKNNTIYTYIGWTKKTLTILYVLV